MSTSNTAGNTGTFTDPADGQVYSWRIMQDGSKWMTQNFSRKTAKSICYDNDENNAGKYGRMYLLHDLIQALPEGWKIPSDNDWNAMLGSKYCGMDNPNNIELIQGGKSGFELMFGGGYNKQNDKFNGIDKETSFLTSNDGSQVTDEHNKLVSAHNIRIFQIQEVRGRIVDGKWVDHEVEHYEDLAMADPTSMSYCRLIEK